MTSVSVRKGISVKGLIYDFNNYQELAIAYAEESAYFVKVCVNARSRPYTRHRIAETQCQIFELSDYERLDDLLTAIAEFLGKEFGKIALIRTKLNGI